MDFVFLSAFFEAASLRCMKDNDKVPWAGCEVVRLKSKRGKRCMHDELILIFTPICSDLRTSGTNPTLSRPTKAE